MMLFVLFNHVWFIIIFNDFEYYKIHICLLQAYLNKMNLI